MKNASLRNTAVLSLIALAVQLEPVTASSEAVRGSQATFSQEEQVFLDSEINAKHRNERASYLLKMRTAEKCRKKGLLDSRNPILWPVFNSKAHAEVCIYRFLSENPDREDDISILESQGFWYRPMKDRSIANFIREMTILGEDPLFSSGILEYISSKILVYSEVVLVKWGSNGTVEKVFVGKNIL